MTHPDPAHPDRNEPKRSPRFNGLVILLIVGLFVVAGAYVWISWSLEDDSAADYAAGHPVRQADVLPGGEVTLTPEGKEAAGRAPADRQEPLPGM